MMIVNPISSQHMFLWCPCHAMHHLKKLDVQISRVKPHVLKRGPHRESIRCHNLNQVRIYFNTLFSQVVKIRFHVSQVSKGQFPPKLLTSQFQWKCRCHQVESTGISSRIIWAKQLTWKLTLGLQLRLWYHQGLNNMFPVLSAKARRNQSQNEMLWHTLNINNVFGPTFNFKNSQ